MAPPPRTDRPRENKDADAQALDPLRDLLRSRLVVTNVDRRRYPAGFVTKDEVISSNRYILILRGGLDYEVDGAEVRLGAGSLLFVPACVRRRWRARGGCENLWCEFSSQTLGTGQHALFRAAGLDMEVERASLSRMLALWREEGRRPVWFCDLGHVFAKKGGEDAGDLLMEGELKASLARFWTHSVRETDAGPGGGRHPEIWKAMLAFERLFPRADALELLYREVDLSPNHLRLLFKQQMGMSPRDYLHGVRMRHARHMLQHSGASVKKIAFATGFGDPLYFSKQYSAYWEHAPSQDRTPADARPSVPD